MYNIIQNSFTQNIIKLSARHMGNLLLLYIKVGNNGFKMTMLENLSSNKQKLTQTNAFYKTRHQSLHKNKNTQFTLMTALLSDESLLTKQSITFSLSLSLGFCFFFLTPNLHKLSITTPWAFSLLNPPLISLYLQFYAVWVFLL